MSDELSSSSSVSSIASDEGAGAINLDAFFLPTEQNAATTISSDSESEEERQSEDDAPEEGPAEALPTKLYTRGGKKLVHSDEKKWTRYDPLPKQKERIVAWWKELEAQYKPEDFTEKPAARARIILKQLRLLLRKYDARITLHGLGQVRSWGANGPSENRKRRRAGAGTYVSPLAHTVDELRGVVIGMRKGKLRVTRRLIAEEAKMILHNRNDD